MSLVITEFSMLVLWCNMEKGAYGLMKYALSENTSNLYMDTGGDKLVGFIVTIISVFVLCNVSIATGFYDQLQDKYKSIARKMSNVWKASSTLEECGLVYDSSSEDNCSLLRRRRRSKTRCN